MPYVAPAGTRLSLGDIALGLYSGWCHGGSNAELNRVLRTVSQSEHAWAVVSGRAAMTIALRAVARQAGKGRNQVIVPAYTCYSVPAAVERAGLVSVPCDIDPRSLSLDLEHLSQISTGRVLAIVTANLFGIPNELGEIERLARERGIYLLDDAAQALGAQIAGRPVGGFGDAGIYSFDKGKNISTIQGGALLARDGPLLRSIAEEYHNLKTARFTDTAITVGKLLPYSVFLRPTGYSMVRRLPMTRLGETWYSTRYPVTSLSRGLAGLALRQLGRLDDYRRVRLSNARALRRALDGIAGLKMVEPLPTAEPAYPRFPLCVESQALRDRLLSALNSAGIGATGFYPRALVDVPEVVRRMPAMAHEFAGAREIARTILTLPTHAYSPRDLAERVRGIIVTALRS